MSKRFLLLAFFLSLNIYYSAVAQNIKIGDSVTRMMVVIKSGNFLKKVLWNITISFVNMLNISVMVMLTFSINNTVIT